MLEKYAEIIATSILFDNIDLDDVLKILECLKPCLKSYKKNEYIFIAGDYHTHLGIIIEGAAAVLSEKANGDRLVIATLKKADVFGETIAFSSLDKWPNTVQAFEKSKIIFIPSTKITAECSKICPWHRSLIENFVKLLSEKALALDEKVKFLAIKGIREKVGSYLYEQYKKTKKTAVVLELNRNELANFLNVSRPSMSRELCKMREERIIDFHLKSFKILDIEALKSISAL